MFLRIAILATVLTSPKSMNGISKLIYPSDFQKLKSHKKLSDIETMLSDAWKACEGLLPQVSASQAFGNFCRRMILLAVMKQKKDSFESFEEVVQQFQDDLKGDSASTAASTEQKKDVKVHDLINCSNADIAKLQNSQIEVGKMFLGSLQLCQPFSAMVLYVLFFTVGVLLVSCEVLS